MSSKKKKAIYSLLFMTQNALVALVLHGLVLQCIFIWSQFKLKKNKPRLRLHWKWDRCKIYFTVCIEKASTVKRNCCSQFQITVVSKDYDNYKCHKQTYQVLGRTFSQISIKVSDSRWLCIWMTPISFLRYFHSLVWNLVYKPQNYYSTNLDITLLNCQCNVFWPSVAITISTF